MPRQDGARQLFGEAAGSYSHDASLVEAGAGLGPGWGVVQRVRWGDRQLVCGLGYNKAAAAAGWQGD